MHRLMIVSLFLCLLSLFACSDDEKHTAPDNTASVDCGQGETISLDGESFCVFQKEVVVENGFSCPPTVSMLRGFGPIGVCHGKPLNNHRLRRIAEFHRMRNNALWASGYCIRSSECGEDQLCTSNAECTDEMLACPEDFEQISGVDQCLQDASCYELADGLWCTGAGDLSCPDGFSQVNSCEEENDSCYMYAEGVFCARDEVPASCAEGETQVGSDAECLQDNAVCYEVSEGVWCTGPDTTSEPACAEGETQVGSDAECLQDNAVCYEIAEGVWCTGPDTPMCPDNFEPISGPEECPDEADEQDCFMLNESLWCRRS